ncbi:MAG: PEPxxWA-CTERM sorting domain-containing protein [Sphingomonas sp.]
MKFVRSTLAAPSLLALSLVLAPAAANAAPTIWSGTGATDSVNFGQLGNFTQVSSGTALTSVGGLGLTLTTGTGGQAQRLNQGNGWGGNFAPGATLLYNQTAGDLTFTFANAVRGVGAQFQANFFGPFTARVTTNDGSFFDVPGVSNSNGNNSAIFIGVQNTVANITSIRFHQQTGTGGNDFAVGNLSLLTGGGVPEPTTWALMIVGFGAVGGAMRTRRSKVSVRFAG